MLIDAKTGMTLLSFNQLDAVLYREIYDNENDPFARPSRIWPCKD